MDIGLTILFSIGMLIGFGFLCVLCKSDEATERLEAERRKILMNIGL